MSPERFSLFRRLRRDDRGATSIEYALIAVGISISVSAIVFTIGTSLRVNFYGKILNAFG